MQNLAAVALTVSLTIAAFSGCLSEAEPSSDASATSGAADPSGTGAPGDANLSAAPVLVVTVLIGELEITVVNGTYIVPAETDVTFDTSGSADPEGKNLSVSWDFGDGNTSSEASPMHAYAAAGLYNATVVVTDEDNVSSSATLAMEVASAGPVSGAVVKVEKKTFTGTLNNPTVVLCGSQQGQGEGQLQKTFYWDFTGAEADGTPTIVNHVVLKMTGQTTAVDIDLYFYDPAGKELGKSTGTASTETIDIEKNFPPGKYSVVAKACTAAQGAFEIKGEATYVVP